MPPMPEVAAAVDREGLEAAASASPTRSASRPLAMPPLSIRTPGRPDRPSRPPRRPRAAHQPAAAWARAGARCVGRRACSARRRRLGAVDRVARSRPRSISSSRVRVDEAAAARAGGERPPRRAGAAAARPAPRRGGRGSGGRARCRRRSARAAGGRRGAVGAPARAASAPLASSVAADVDGAASPPKQAKLDVRFGAHDWLVVTGSGSASIGFGFDDFRFRFGFRLRRLRVRFAGSQFEFFRIGGFDRFACGRLDRSLVRHRFPPLRPEVGRLGAVLSARRGGVDRGLVARGPGRCRSPSARRRPPRAGRSRSARSRRRDRAAVRPAGAGPRRRRPGLLLSFLFFDRVHRVSFLRARKRP